ncbi:unnamed protein product [Rhizophagus irregularis]|nr:unnamed protein product [Rhizophagus irregularis]
MPAPGDVDFIYCGPPCQGFSGVNRYQKADDIKNSLVATALSYVDFYRPEFFLLKMSLTAMGYQNKGSINVLLPDGTSFTYNHRTNGYAPYPAVSVREAINDLPEFEFVNPHQVYPAEKEDKELQRPFRQIEVPERGWVGDMETEYGSEPLSEYQRQSRKDWCTCVQSHCRVFNKLTIERIVRIAMFPGADHSSLPEKLKPWCLSDPNSAASRHNGWKGLFGRLDFEGHFGHGSNRYKSNGENRGRFYSDRDDTKDMHRQIGNAVPPPLAYALGRLLVEAVFKKHMENKKLKGKGKLVV